MDWNWFFSSIAQAMAAIVGIFSAFIITKVINNQNEFTRKRIRLQELLSTGEKFIEAFSKRYIPWLTEKRLESAFLRLKYRLEKGERKSAEQFYIDVGFPLYAERKTVLDQIRNVIEHFVPESERPPRTSYGAGLISMVKSEGQLQRDFEQNQQLRKDLDGEEESVNTLITEARHHIKLANLHLAEIETNPESSHLVTISISGAAILFLFGVIYPLSFLPLSSSLPELSVIQFFVVLFSFKGLMLLIPSVIFLGILGVFAKANFQLKYKPEDVIRLKEATILGNYSPYLAVMENNKKDLAESNLSNRPS